MGMVEKGLSQRQHEVLHYIKKSIKENKIPPTIIEICRHFKLASTNGVHQHLTALEKKGFIKRNNGASRGIIVVENTKNDLLINDDEKEVLNSSVQKLMIIGEGDAENYMSVFSGNCGHLFVDKRMFDLTGNMFAATVQDNGLLKEGLCAGDMVIFSFNQKPESGCKALVLVNDQRIIREYLANENGYVLKASDRGFPKMSFKFDDPSAVVLGEVKGCIKSEKF